MVQGVHFMPLGWSDIVPEIIREMELPAASDRVSGGIAA